MKQFSRHFSHPGQIGTSRQNYQKSTLGNETLQLGIQLGYTWHALWVNKAVNHLIKDEQS
ncbi:hypothetical protein MARHY1624 [Marinobacter nauticus ATCC 49840]|nr:hypothetical protein MARHY1624 [Marinobacter nauticus ATCC 49840]